MSEKDRVKVARDVMKRAFKNWGYIASCLKITEAEWVETAATDGYHFYYNPKFTEKLTDKQLNFLWAHEVFHVASNHITRTPAYVWDLEPMRRKYVLHKWNVARDHAIHQILKPIIDKCPDVLEWIPEGLYDEKYKGMASEKIYKSIEDPPKIMVNVHIIMDGSGTPLLIDGEGNEQPIPGMNDEMGKAVKERIKGVLDKINEKLKGQKKPKGGRRGGYGTHNTSLRTRSDHGEQTERSWRDDLIELLVFQARSDYSYKRYHRGWYHQTGMILPTLRSELLKGVIAIDVSPSIKRYQYQKFTVEIDAIRGQIPDHELTLIFCGSHITAVKEVKSGEPVDWTLPGGSGTAFRPVFDYITQQGIDTNFLIYFTDGENWSGDILDDVEAPYEILWLLWAKPHYTYIPENLGKRIIMHEKGSKSESLVHPSGVS